MRIQKYVLIHSPHAYLCTMFLTIILPREKKSKSFLSLSCCEHSAFPHTQQKITERIKPNEAKQKPLEDRQPKRIKSIPMK